MTTLLIRLEPYDSEQYSHPHNVYPPLDIGYAASLLEREGLKSDFIDIPVSGVSEEEIVARSRDADHVFIKFTTTSFDKATRIARSLHCVAVGIGQHPSTLPETCLEGGFAACIRGEPEEMILRIVQRGDHRQDGVVYLDRDRVVPGSLNLVKDPTSLPMPKHDWFIGVYQFYYPSRINTREVWGFVMATRGCPCGCTFCSPTLRSSFGDQARRRAVRDVVDEIELLKSKGVNVVYFLDDDIGSSREWLLSLCDEIISRRIRMQWVTQLRADHVSGELVSRMKAAGCTTLCVGVESGVDQNLRTICKGQTVQAISRAFDTLHRLDMLSVAFFMIGLPGETEGEIHQTMSLMKRLSPDLSQVAFFTPFPGSVAFDKQGREVQFSEFLHYDKPVNNSSRVSDQRLKELQREFYRAFYLRPAYAKTYLKIRLAKLLTNPRDELQIIAKSLRFFLRG